MKISHIFHFEGRPYRLYKRARSGREAKLSDPWFLRLRTGGKDQPRSLQTSDVQTAIHYARERIRASRSDKYSEFLAATSARATLTIGEIVAAYRKAGCPDRHSTPRPSRTLETEARNCHTLVPWWSAHIVSTASNALQDQYRLHRVAEVTRGKGGDRTAELELVTLRNALHWAVRAGRIATNPITEAYRYRTSDRIDHAHQFMPRSGDEAHRLAAALLGNRDTESFGWEFLLQLLTGLRHSEIRLLAVVRQPIDPLSAPPAGHFDEKFLSVQRTKRSKRRRHSMGLNPRVRLDDPARPNILDCLKSIAAWRATRFPDADWMIPSPTGGQLALDAKLTSALRPVCVALGLPARRSHGARAYYATARLAQGISPAQVAYELGQDSGEQLVKDIYGETPPQWDGLTNTFTWVPNTAELRPAWELWNAPANIVGLNVTT